MVGAMILAVLGRATAIYVSYDPYDVPVTGVPCESKR
jgi:hypothetical protein